MGGSSGPSGLDAVAWMCLCTSFCSSSNHLCAALSSLGRHLCTEYIDPVSLYRLLSSHLIALDKNPGVRPIGMGETTRCLLGKAILYVIGPDVLGVPGWLLTTLCRSTCGCEAAVHAIRDLFSSTDYEAVYLLMRVMHSTPLISECPS